MSDIEHGSVVVVCIAPEDDTLVYGPFVDQSSAKVFVDEGPCDNEHVITRVIDDVEV